MTARCQPPKIHLLAEDPEYPFVCPCGQWCKVPADPTMRGRYIRHLLIRRLDEHGNPLG